MLPVTVCNQLRLHKGGLFEYFMRMFQYSLEEVYALMSQVISPPPI